MQNRHILNNFEPYRWEPSNTKIASELGLNIEKIIRFDTNTSPIIPQKWLEKLCSMIQKINVNDYPDTSYLSLRTSISNCIKTDPDKIIITNGADEGLDVFAKAYIDKGITVLISAPTYPYYKTITQLAEGNIISIFRKKDFLDNEKSLLKFAKRQRPCVVFLCSPNNPTGNCSERNTIIKLLETSDTIVVVDEAYSEFSGKTVIDLTEKYDNLIILKTFSKAFSLAGARVGYIVSSSNTIKILNKVRPPNSLSIISLVLAEIALNDVETVQNNIQSIIKERDRCKNFLQELKEIMVYPSESNFLLIKFQNINPNIVHKLLMQKGLIVRNVSGTRMLEKCLRFNIRLPNQNDLLLESIAKILDNK